MKSNDEFALEFANKIADTKEAFSKEYTRKSELETHYATKADVYKTGGFALTIIFGTIWLLYSYFTPIMIKSETSKLQETIEALTKKNTDEILGAIEKLQTYK